MAVLSADTDIAIIGGGPVGAALALFLGKADGADLRVTVLEARTGRSAGDPRPIALSYGSRLLLERLGVWPALAGDSAAAAIDSIHVSQRGGFGRAAMSAADVGLPNLGYVFDYNDIFISLTSAVRNAGCDYIEGASAHTLVRDSDFPRIGYTCNDAETLTARLVVIADGGDIDGLAPPKTIDYGQQALTARVRTSLPHRHAAYERFTPEGPLALLPFGRHGDEMALVWTLKPARAEELRDADAPTFLAALRAAFGARLGDFREVTQRACHPLLLRYAAQDAAPGVVTIGNASQTLHPVAGQGFNLGLRDAWELAQLLCTVPVQSVGGDALLRRYRARRRIDRTATLAATHGMVRVFSNDFLPLQALRGAGLTVMGCIAPARDFMARRMIFGARG